MNISKENFNYDKHMYKMYKCRTCNKEVAQTAITCPHCGDTDCVYNAEIKSQKNFLVKKNKKRRWTVFLILLPIWLIFGFNLHGGGWVGPVLWLISLPVSLSLIAVLPFEVAPEDSDWGFLSERKYPLIYNSETKSIIDRIGECEDLNEKLRIK